MIMFKCADCGHIFSEYDAKVEQNFLGYYGDEAVYEGWNSCPHCNSTDLEEYYGEDEDE